MSDGANPWLIGAGIVGSLYLMKPAHTPLGFAFYPRPPEHSKADFYAWLGPIARDTQRRTGIPASVRMAQAWRESRATGGGLNKLATVGRNLFGMKRGRCTMHYAIGSGAYATWEERPAGPTPERHEFAHYPSHYAGALQQCRLFYCAGAYASALAYRTNPRQFLERIGPIYATHSAYVEAVWNDVQHWDLTRYDLAPHEWALEAAIVGEQHKSTWLTAIGHGRPS